MAQASERGYKVGIGRVGEERREGEERGREGVATGVGHGKRRNMSAAEIYEKCAGSALSIRNTHTWRIAHAARPREKSHPWSGWIQPAEHLLAHESEKRSTPRREGGGRAHQSRSLRRPTGHVQSISRRLARHIMGLLNRTPLASHSPGEARYCAQRSQACIRDGHDI